MAGRSPGGRVKPSVSRWMTEAVRTRPSRRPGWLAALNPALKLCVPCLLFAAVAAPVMAQADAARASSAPAAAADTASARLSPETWRALSAIHRQHLSASRWNEALSPLQALLRQSGLPAFDRAVVQQNIGHVLMRLGRHDDAVAAFEAGLADRLLPVETERAVRLQTAQAHVARSRWQAARGALQALFDAAGTPAPAEAHLLAAAASREMSDWRAAAHHIERALKLSGRREPSWLQLRAYSLIELGEHAAAADAVLELLELDPSRQAYWRQLGQIYAAMKQDERRVALAALEARMTSPDADTVRALVALYRQIGLPDRAARMLQRALAQGRLPRESAHFEWLANLWLESRETDAALQALAEADRLAPDARFALLRAQMMSTAGRWQEALTELDRLLAHGRPEQPGKVWLMLGIAAHEAGQRDRAIAALRRAEGRPESRDEAVRWLRYVGSQ